MFLHTYNWIKEVRISDRPERQRIDKIGNNEVTAIERPQLPEHAY